MRERVDVVGEAGVNTRGGTESVVCVRIYFHMEGTTRSLFSKGGSSGGPYFKH